MNPFGDRLTFWSCVIGLFFSGLGLAINQTTVQRFVALKTERGAKMWDNWKISIENCPKRFKIRSLTFNFENIHLPPPIYFFKWWKFSKHQDMPNFRLSSFMQVLLLLSTIHKSLARCQYYADLTIKLHQLVSTNTLWPSPIQWKLLLCHFFQLSNFVGSSFDNNVCPDLFNRICCFCLLSHKGLWSTESRQSL